MCTFVVLTWGILAQRPAAAIPADCDTPDDFCVGDPCRVARSIDITAASCVLDFGTRDLIISGAIRVPNGGSVSLRAKSIALRHKINAAHPSGSQGDGGDITLQATGTIAILGNVDASGDRHCGAIRIEAGGAVDIRKLVRSRTRSHSAAVSGGVVTIRSGAAFTTAQAGRIDVRGAHGTIGGDVSITAADDITLESRIDASGDGGGTIALTSSGGTVYINDRVRANGGGGTVELSAATDVRLIQLPGAIDVSGHTLYAGGTINLTAGNEINVAFLSARGGGDAPGGSVMARAVNVLLSDVDLRGGVAGGDISIQSDNRADLVTGDLRSQSGRGGRIRINATDAALEDIAAAGTTNGGDIRVHVTGQLQLGVPGRSIDVTAPVGGTIEGHAGGDLYASGNFHAADGGCIALSAGGTLHSASANFNVPVGAACP